MHWTQQQWQCKDSFTTLILLCFFCENPSIHALLFQISRFQFISQFVVQIVDLELKYFTIKKYFVKFYLFSPESELDWKVKWHKFSAHFHTSAYLSISFRSLILLVRVPAIQQSKVMVLNFPTPTYTPTPTPMWSLIDYAESPPWHSLPVIENSTILGW